MRGGEHRRRSWSPNRCQPRNHRKIWNKETFCLVFRMMLTFCWGLTLVVKVLESINLIFLTIINVLLCIVFIVRQDKQYLNVLNTLFHMTCLEVLLNIYILVFTWDSRTQSLFRSGYQPRSGSSVLRPVSSLWLGHRN